MDQDEAVEEDTQEKEGSQTEVGVLYVIVQLYGSKCIKN